jgi:uncharacterized protein (DUF58 family)
MPDTPLFDEPTRRKLEQLMLAASRVRAGAIKGERRSNKRGTSIEFADYRNYSPGDDLRRLDWNIYARLDRPLMKVFEDEEDLAVYILLDTSASMEGGVQGGSEGVDNPDTHKFTYARRLAAGLAYISLLSNDRLTVTALNPDLNTFGPVRGRGYGSRLLRFIGDLTAHGAIDLNTTLKNYVIRMKRPGLAIVISDLFSPSGYIDGLNALLAKGCEVAIVHTLAPDELEPPLGGDLRLIDVETGAVQEVSIDGGLRDLYIRRVQAWQEGIRAECTRRGIHYTSADTRTGWERLILQDLRRLGVVR